MVVLGQVSQDLPVGRGRGVPLGAQASQPRVTPKLYSPAPLIWHQFPVIPGGHTEGLHPASAALAVPFVILLLRRLDGAQNWGWVP